MCPVLTDEIAPYRRRLIDETVRNPLLELAMSGLPAVSVLAKVKQLFVAWIASTKGQTSGRDDHFYDLLWRPNGCRINFFVIQLKHLISRSHALVEYCSPY